MNRIKNYLQKLHHDFVVYFIPKRIVYSNGYPSGVLVKAVQVDGKDKYLTIAVTNVAFPGGQNTAFVYHVPIRKVIGIKKSTTPFIRWLYIQVLNKQVPLNRIKPLKKTYENSSNGKK